MNFFKSLHNSITKRLRSKEKYPLFLKVKEGPTFIVDVESCEIDVEYEDYRCGGVKTSEVMTINASKLTLIDEHEEKLR